jgi:hypothetical protein
MYSGDTRLGIYGHRITETMVGQGMEGLNKVIDTRRAGNRNANQLLLFKGEH